MCPQLELVDILRRGQPAVLRKVCRNARPQQTRDHHNSHRTDVSVSGEWCDVADKISSDAVLFHPRKKLEAHHLPQYITFGMHVHHKLVLLSGSAWLNESLCAREPV